VTQQSGRTVIVTGASRGIGAAVARRLAADGFSVVVSFAGASGEADAQVKDITSAGGTALAIQADVSDSASVRQLFDRTEAAFGGIDVLVNNAGIMQVVRIADADDAVFDRHIAVNLKGVFNGMREAAGGCGPAAASSASPRYLSRTRTDASSRTVVATLPRVGTVAYMPTGSRQYDCDHIVLLL
jgi:NAD(P)-dependent dehydrogenase (short-subunit alcohol dehydrogenase family)